MRLTRLLLVKVLVLASLVAVPTGATAASTTTKVKNCSITVVGKDASTGQLITSDPVCSSGPAAAGGAQAMSASLPSGVLAIHYTGYNFSGSTLTVYGSGCTGGWLNVPAAWANWIASTQSDCVTSHYDYFYLTGDVEAIWGSGNLTYMAYRTNSLQYN